MLPASFRAPSMPYFVAVCSPVSRGHKPFEVNEHSATWLIDFAPARVCLPGDERRCPRSWRRSSTWCYSWLVW